MNKENDEVERSELLALLEQWREGVIDERVVHERAEAILERLGRYPDYPDADPRSIPVEVLSHLETLNHQLISPADIPVMEAFLHTQPGDELQGWRVWQNYWNRLDIEGRERELKNNPSYSI